MYRDWAALALSFIVLLIMGHCIQISVRWATPRATLVVDRVRCAYASLLLMLFSHGAASEYAQGGERDVAMLPLQAMGRIYREVKVTCMGCMVRLEGAMREPFANVFFHVEYIRSERNTRVVLNLDQVDFGIKNRCTRNCSSLLRSCDSICNPGFIYKFTIEVCAKSWADACYNVLCEPPVTTENFALGWSNTFGLQIPLVNIKQASLSYQTSRNINRTAKAFEWGPAFRDDGTNSITWPFELYRWSNGRKLKFNKWRWGSRLQIGIQPSSTQLHPESFVAKATYEFPLTEELQHRELEWDMKVSLHTAVFESRYGGFGYSIAKGPTVTYKKRLTFP